nr:restriction endonuclease subunit S [Xanthomonas sp. LMG 8992]
MPVGWATCSVGDIFDVVGGGTPPAADAGNFSNAGTAHAWLTPADLSGYKKKLISHGARDLSAKGMAASSAKLMPAGSVLFTSRAPIGYVAIAEGEISTNQGFKSFILPDDFDPSYVYYYLKSIRNLAESRGTGTTFKELSGAATKELPFVIAPLAEQKRIAQKLDALLAQVDILKTRIDAIPALLKRFRQSVLTSAATCELTSEWRATQGLDDPVPTKLGELIRKGPQNGLYKPSSTYGSGIKIVRIDGFYSGELRDWHSFRSLQLDTREEQVWALNVGDILINRVNSIEYLGKCALVRSLPGPTVFESNIMRIVVDERVIEPEFLMRALSAEIGRARLIGNAKHAVNQASINQGDVRACPILVPTLSEQTEIVSRVEQLFAYADQLEAKVAAAQQRIDALTQSLLAKAFRGELVPQDPTDEPASVLLERIRAQRAATHKPKRGRKPAAH